MTARKASFVPPMLASLVKPASHYVSARPGEWQYERKLDGLRCLAVRNADRVELLSRNRLSFNARFPDVAAALADLQVKSLVVDGELVAFDGDQTSFSLLQSSPHPQGLTYCLFDLLHVNGRDTTGLVLTERQALLAQELVIGGWTEPTRSRVGLGALLVGYYEDGAQLRYAGKVGTGFTNRLLRQLHEELLARAVPESPFFDPVREKTAHWARPDLVGEVAFTEWTADGRLRHPSFQGLRPDKAATEVRREARD